MITIIRMIEQTIAYVLRMVAVVLNQAASVFEPSPVSGLCQSTLDRVWNWTEAEKSAAWLIPFSITVSLIFVFGMPMLFKFLSDGAPHLETVPVPSATFDPAEDRQSESFGDDDVRPQLVGPEVKPSIEATDPSTGALLGYVAAHTVDDVDKLVSKARVAQKAWASSSFDRRRRVIRVLSNYVLYEQQSLSKICSLDCGKPLQESSLMDIAASLEKFQWLISDGEEALKPSRRKVGKIVPHKVAHVEYSPVGVIAAITPWNLPINNIFNPVSAALFAGCAIVVKPSELTVWSAVHVIRVVRRALTVCGEDPELVQCLIGEGDVGSKLVKADGVDKVFFTGSTATGRKVATAAAERLRPTCLELGGKDVCIVADDADVANAVDVSIRGVFSNSGQLCIALERIYVHRKVKEEFVRRAVDIVKKMRVGVDLGAITMGTVALTRLEGLVEDAVSRGAKVLAGGKRTDLDGKGWFFEPTVIVNMKEDMRMAKEEVFGPILSIYDWEDEDTMLETVNSCTFGLGSTVCSEDKARANRLQQELEVGMCNVNDFATTAICQSLPFGGTKNSGSGRNGGIEGLHGCCKIKSTTRDRFVGFKTAFPKVLRYPVGANVAEFAYEINDLIFRGGVIGKMDNLRQLIGMTLFPSWRPRSVASG